MGSSAIQANLWSRRSKDWAEIQEATGKAGYTFALQHLDIKSATLLLDVGCGTGYFCKMAADLDAVVTGIDATETLLEEARERLPDAAFIAGEMEELPFGDEAFDIVCGFNSFQYAANTGNAITEAARVLKPGGKLVAMIWGDQKDCEAATYLRAVGSLLPVAPPGAPGPFALSENALLEKLIQHTGLTIIINEDVAAVWDYPDKGTALKGLMSAGPVTRAIDHAGFDSVHQAISDAIVPYTQGNGHVVYHNTFRVVIATK